MADRVRIYQQPKTAMQSGRAGTQEWVVAFAPSAQHADPLMGWIGGGSTDNQLRLRFDSREEAVAYAEKRGLTYDVEIARPHRVVPKSYSDNFRFGRVENWTH